MGNFLSDPGSPDPLKYPWLQKKQKNNNNNKMKIAKMLKQEGPRGKISLLTVKVSGYLKGRWFPNIAPVGKPKQVAEFP